MSCRICGSSTHWLCQRDQPGHEVLGGTIRLYKPTFRGWVKRQCRNWEMKARREYYDLRHPVRKAMRPILLRRARSLHAKGHDGWAGLPHVHSCERCVFRAAAELHFLRRMALGIVVNIGTRR